MSGVYESLKETYGNFKKYAECSTVPAVKKSDNSRVSQNSFYKSVYYIDSVVGPVKDAVFGVERNEFSINGQKAEVNEHSLGGRKSDISPAIGVAVRALTHIVLQPLYLALAYLSYWPAKGLAKVTDKFDLKDKTKSLVDYSSTLSKKALEHSKKVARFVNVVLSYVCTAVIWATALIITPLTWAVDKVSSKFSGVKEPEAVNPHENGVTA